MDRAQAQAGGLGARQARVPFSEGLEALKAAQKPSAGTPLYSRLVNRPVGRVLGAVAMAIGLGPNGISLVSASFSFAGIALVAFAHPLARRRPRHHRAARVRLRPRLLRRSGRTGHGSRVAARRVARPHDRRRQGRVAARRRLLERAPPRRPRPRLGRRRAALRHRCERPVLRDDPHRPAAPGRGCAEAGRLVRFVRPGPRAARAAHRLRPAVPAVPPVRSDLRLLPGVRPALGREPAAPRCRRRRRWVGQLRRIDRERSAS